MAEKFTTGPILFNFFENVICLVIYDLLACVLIACVVCRVALSILYNGQLSYCYGPYRRSGHCYMCLCFYFHDTKLLLKCFIALRHFGSITARFFGAMTARFHFAFFRNKDDSVH